MNATDKVKKICTNYCTSSVLLDLRNKILVFKINVLMICSSCGLVRLEDESLSTPMIKFSN